MTKWPGTRSLFWTFAGAFLAVLVVATVLQLFAVGTVMRPIAERWVRTHAELLAQRAASDIGNLPPTAGNADIENILVSYRKEMESVRLVFRKPGGEVLTGRRMPPGMVRLLSDHPVEEWDHLDPADREPPDPESPDRPRGPRPRGRDRRDRPRSRVLSRQPVDTSSRVQGEVIALGFHVPRRFHVLPHDIPRPLLLYLPLALLLSGAAGLIMVRLLLRRLRALEDLAGRVSEGDLDARVPNPGRDEIGRLGERLNRMTEKLKEARRHLEESDRQRRQLFADISHELATPLTSIRGYTETLLEPKVPVSDQERVTFLANILEESERMDLLIDDLLDLTRLEAGATNLETTVLDWTELCRNTMDRFRPRFEQAGLKIHWTGPADPVRVVADGRRLEQVLDNLLVNALRYVPSGGTVTLSLDPAPDPPDRARLTVSDDGPGFPEEDLPHIFDRFYRASAARAATGSGLGLAIVKEIVDQHEGEVRAENRKPSGATILIDLPAEKQGT